MLERPATVLGVSAEQPEGQLTPDISMAEDMVGGVWANYAQVSHSPFEFTVDFIRLDFGHVSQQEGTIPGRVVSRVNLSPLFVTQLLEALTVNWQMYAEKALPREAREDESD